MSDPKDARFKVGDKVRCLKGPFPNMPERGGAGWKPGFVFNVTSISDSYGAGPIYWKGHCDAGVYEYALEKLEEDWDD
jgi:hypothetical protein